VVLEVRARVDRPVDPAQPELSDLWQGRLVAEVCMKPRAGFTHESTHNESVEWYTPPEVFRWLGDPTFDLDPCSAPPEFQSYVPAKVKLTRKDDGLHRAVWKGSVWLNPPYGRGTGPWLSRMGLHGDGLALVFARTDNGWFHDTIPNADAVLFLRGRIKFIRPDGSRGDGPGAGSMLLAWGKKWVDVARVGEKVGRCALQGRPPTAGWHTDLADERLGAVTRRLDGPVPLHTAAREGGAEEKAAEKIAVVVGTLRYRVFDIYRRAKNGLTPDEVCATLSNLNPYSVRPRCTELLQGGYLCVAVLLEGDPPVPLQRPNRRGNLEDVLEWTGKEP